MSNMSSRSTVLKEQNRSLKLPMLMGIVATLICVGGLGSWSWLATITSAVIVPGVVVVDSGRKYVQHLDGGIVKSIDIEDGQEVLANQVLMSLDSEVLDIGAAAIERLLGMNLGAQDRLHAERDGLTSPSFPTEMNFTERTDWLRIQKEQSELFAARRLSLRTKIETLQSDGYAAVAAARGVGEQIEAQYIKINLTKQELQTAEGLARSGYGTRQRVLDIDRSLAELHSELSGLNSRAREFLQTSEHDRLESLQQGAVFSETVSVELQQAEKEYAELLLKLNTINQQREKLNIRAPVSGRVVNLAVHTIGGVIGAGATVLEIVPKTDFLVIEAKVRPDDIENIEVGLQVGVRLAGIKGQQLPRLTGVLTQVSADRIEDLRRDKSYFRVRAEVTKASVIRLGLHELRPGLAVTLMIRKGEQSPLDYLVSPLVGFFSRALK